MISNEIKERVRDELACNIFTVEFVRRLLSPEVGAILGPAHVSYADGGGSP